ncbi:MAG: transposase [Alphaproteobacteria bacterium]|nr:MAG: transposase [Alphaproteobacteria bacterium]
MIDLDGFLPADHRARVVWAFVEGLDLAAFYDRIKARENSAGRPPVDPKIHLSLWLYATAENVGSARAIARACKSDLAYRWLCGGVSTNHHSLSDFRRDQDDLLDDVLSRSVAALIAEGLIDLEEVVQDGTKVRAAAGRGTMVGAEGLDRLEAAARWRVHRLKEELESDPGVSDRRGRAARERAAREMTDRAAKARKTYETLQAEKAKAARKHRQAEEKKSARKVSRSDPEARMMKFADQAHAPGYNVQLAASGLFVVGLDVTQRHNDTGLAAPMIAQLETRYDRVPKRLVVDGRIATQSEIVELSQHPKGAIEVIAPVPAEREDLKPESRRRRARRKAGEPEAIKAWRSRMQTAEAQAALGRRKLIETINAMVKNRGMGRMLVRGRRAVQKVVILHALTNNMMQAHRARSPA